MKAHDDPDEGLVEQLTTLAASWSGFNRDAIHVDAVPGGASAWDADDGTRPLERALAAIRHRERLPPGNLGRRVLSSGRPSTSSSWNVSFCPRYWVAPRAFGHGARHARPEKRRTRSRRVFSRRLPRAPGFGSRCWGPIFRGKAFAARGSANTEPGRSAKQPPYRCRFSSGSMKDESASTTLCGPSRPSRRTICSTRYHPSSVSST